MDSVNKKAIYKPQNICYNHSIIRWVTPPAKKAYGVDEVRRDAASAFLVRSKTQKVTQ